MKLVIYVNVKNISIGVWESAWYFFVNLCHPWIQDNFTFPEQQQFPQKANSVQHLGLLLRELLAREHNN